MIREAKEFVDNDGRKVTGYYPYNEDPQISGEKLDIHIVEDGNPIFRGSVGIRTGMGVMPIEFAFPEDYRLQDCFEHFEENADKAVEEMRKEAEEKNLIMTPDQARQQGVS